MDIYSNQVRVRDEGQAHIMCSFLLFDMWMYYFGVTGPIHFSPKVKFESSQDLWRVFNRIVQIATIKAYPHTFTWMYLSIT